MGIPTIQPYSMPRGDDLPKNRVSWRIHPGRSVLLIHDMQQYFLDYYDTQASPVVELLANINLVRRRCASSGVPVVYTMQPAQQTPEQRGLLLDLWGPGLTEHPHKHPIVSELMPGDTDAVLTKWRYSAFQRTELLDLMRRLGRDQMIICGVYAHIGCLLTACDAFMNDIQPFFVSDATSDFSPELHTMAITYVAQRCGVALSTREVVASLEPGATGGIAPRDVSPSSLGGAPQGDALCLERLRSEVSDLLQEPLSEMSDRDQLLDLGLDSIRIMTLVERLRGMGIDISFVELAERPTLADWWEFLSRRAPLTSAASR